MGEPWSEIDIPDEIRYFGTHKFLLRDLYKGGRDEHSMPVFFSLWHFVGEGPQKHFCASYPEAQKAWSRAARHAAAVDLSGNCDEIIAVRLAGAGGKVHQGHVYAKTTACGLDLPGSALDYRVPGNGRDRSVVTCGRCVIAGFVV